ncbi:MAG: hypothetical protein CMJ27_13715, partial [Phycisphaerae bacterium]
MMISIDVRTASFAAFMAFTPVGLAVAGDGPTVGLIESSPDAAPGYTLFTPLNSMPTYLVDINGEL